MVEGRYRARLRRLWQTEPFLQANVETLAEEEASEAFRRSPRTEALLRQTWNLFSEYAELAGSVPDEVITTVMDCRDVGYLADFITQNIALRHTDKQEILEEMAPFIRLRKLNGFLARECNVLGFEHEDLALDADDVTDIVFLEAVIFLFAHLIDFDEDLNPAGGILQVAEHHLALAPLAHQPPSDPNGLALEGIVIGFDGSGIGVKIELCDLEGITALGLEGCQLLTADLRLLGDGQLRLGYKLCHP